MSSEYKPSAILSQTGQLADKQLGTIMLYITILNPISENAGTIFPLHWSISPVINVNFFECDFLNDFLK